MSVTRNKITLYQRSNRKLWIKINYDKINNTIQLLETSQHLDRSGVDQMITKHLNDANAWNYWCTSIFVGGPKLCLTTGRFLE